MNYNKYGSYYGNFHKFHSPLVSQDIMVFNFGTSPYETWFITRMYPSDRVYVASNKALLLALKTFFKSDVPASVVCNSKYLWTICLGKERMIIPVGKEDRGESTLQLYATPYYVKDISVISQYLKGMIRPAYENVFFYENTVLYLDNEDLPFPGGFYFNPCESTPYYRLCFLSNKSLDTVLKIASKWKTRQGIVNIPYMTRDIQVIPKFINFQPVSDTGFSEADISSTGIVYKLLSCDKSEHIIQDILNSYYKNVSRRIPDSRIDVGLLIEWPILLTFEGARYSDNNRQPKKFVALSVNGLRPSRVLQVYRPYDRYIEYNHVPATLWTPISFVLSTLLTDMSIKKVAIDTAIIGVMYRETFFCFDQVLLEGMPKKDLNKHGNYILSTATFNLDEDSNVQVIESFKINESYSLRKVSLKGLPLDTWCLTKFLNTDPYPKNIRLTGLVKQWINFFMEVGENKFDVDVSAVRLALMLSKHNICFNLIAAEKPKQIIEVTDNQVNFFMNEKMVQFINDARMIKNDDTVESSSCILS